MRPPSAPLPDYLTVAEAAGRADVTPRAVRLWIARGLLPAARQGLRRLTVPADALAALLARARGGDDLPATRRAQTRAKAAMARDNAPGRPWRCPGCGEPCPSPEDLAAHLVAVHGRGLRALGRPRGSGRSRPPARCRTKNCGETVDTRRGGGRGFCATCYQRRRRSGRA